MYEELDAERSSDEAGRSLQLVLARFHASSAVNYVCSVCVGCPIPDCDADWTVLEKKVFIGKNIGIHISYDRVEAVLRRNR